MMLSSSTIKLIVALCLVDILDAVCERLLTEDPSIRERAEDSLLRAAGYVVHDTCGGSRTLVRQAQCMLPVRL